MIRPPRHCSACDTPLPEAAQFCFECGTPVPRPASASPRPEASTIAERLQRCLGEGYQVRSQLGHGGFAEVYAVWDQRLKREVAVKVLRPELGLSQVLLERFRREAESAASLRHPSIIPVYSVGEGDGLAYIVMPLIKGETLRARLDAEGPLTLGEARRIIVEAAAALAAAHETGMTHRDIKPENIMLEGRERRVLLMDFGIAKPTATADQRLTETGLILGTPHYMSPEQAAGDREVDHRADQYALAAVAYELLAGCRAFDGDSAQKILHQQLMAKAKPLDNLRPEVPLPLVTVIDRAMAKDPSQRFANMTEFAAALAEVELPAEPARIPPAHSAPPPPSPGFVRALFLAGLAGVLTFLLSYGANHPEAGTFVGVRREAAESTAAALFAGRGAVGSFDRVTLVHPIEEDHLFKPTEPRTFLFHTLGPEAALAWARRELPLWYFRSKWSDPRGKQLWVADVATNGRVTRFTAPTADPAASSSLAEDSARTIAEAFLRGLEWDHARLTVFDRRAMERGNRYEFTWEDAAARIPWKDTLSANAGTVLVQVTVNGDRVTGYRHYFQPPEGFSSRAALGVNPAGPANLLKVVGFVLCILLFASAVIRRGASQFRVREMLRLALLVAALAVAGGVSSWPQMGNDPDGSIEGSPVMFLIFMLVAMPALPLLVMWPMTALAEFLAREPLRANIEGLIPLLQGQVLTRPVVQACLYGSGLGALALGLRAVADILERTWSSTWIQPFEAPVLLFNTLSPAVTLVAATISSTLWQATALFLTISLARRYLKSVPLTLLATILLAVVLVWPADTWVSAGLLGLLWAWAFLRVGLLSCVVGLFVVTVANAGMELVTAGAGNRTALAAVTIGLLLLPAGVAALARKRMPAAPGPPPLAHA